MPAPRKHAVRRLTAQALATPWAILPERLAAFCEILSLRRQGLALDDGEIESRLEGLREEPVAADQLLALYPVAAPVPGRTPRTGMNSAPSSPPSAGQSVAVLTIQGTLVPRRIDSANASGGGFVSAEGVAQAFRQAASNPDVSTIVIDINSPGGAVAGIPELAATIREAVANGTRVIAVANHLMASAAFWIGAQASEVVASPSADVGSVGVLAIHQETSQADAQAGITTTVFRSVAAKAELNSVEPLSAEARARVTERIAAVHEQFVADLAAGRRVSLSTVATAFGSGRVLSAAEALAAGMIDRVATLDQVLAELLGGTGTPAGVTPTTAGDPARPTLPPVLENYSMDPQLLTALIRCGAITAAATADQAESARQMLLTMAGCDLSAAVQEQVAALARVSTSLNRTSSTPVAAAVPPPALPSQAPVSATSGTLSVQDAIAMVRVSALEAAAQLDLIGQLTSSAEPLTPQGVLGRIQQQTQASQPAAGVRIGVAEAEADKFAVAARDALLQRTWRANVPTQIWSNVAQDFVAWQAPRRPNHFLGSLPNMARQSLIVAGFDARQVNQLANAEVARLVLGADPLDFGILRAEGAAYNGRAQFSNLLFDAANVVLRRSYAETTATFTAWAKPGESFVDFKPRHNVIAGELSDPQVIPENGTFEETTLLDGREPYSVVTWGERFTITWNTLVDDRLAALTDIPAKQGAAMRRKQNRIVYGVLKDNAALVNDGIALFNAATHKNLTTGPGTAMSVASFNVAYTAMQQQTGLNSGVFVAVEPRYLLIPPALRGTGLELLGATANPASSNSGVGNIWQNGLQPVVDVELSTAAGGSDTAWYFAGDSSQVDTVEYAYLQGLETPAFERQNMFDRLAIAMRMYQCFGAKAIDYRGLYKNTGA
jgi:signal peptide peptidase SppA